MKVLRAGARAARLAATAGGAGLLLVACTLPVRFATPAEVQQATAPSPAPAPSSGAQGSGGGGLAQLQAELRALVNSVSPSVVRVDTGTASGSGLVLDALGTVVTPAALVAGATQITVTTAAGQAYPGTVAGSDAASGVAVLRVSGASGLKPAGFGDSGGVQLGDVVVVIGSPAGGSGSVSQGIVSGTAGTLSVGGATLARLIQTSAPAASGSSGSALVNISGQVIGMTAAGPATAGSLAVAIPSNQVTAEVQKLTGGGSGATTGTADLGILTADAPSGGALVQSVVAGGPAARAGIQVGWTVIGIDGQAVADSAAVGRILAGLSPGRHVVVTVVLPDGSTRSVGVVLGSA